MKTLVIATLALATLAAVTTAQAEIICTNQSCWETGKRIYRNGGAATGLPYMNHRDDGRPKKRVRILREF